MWKIPTIRKCVTMFIVEIVTRLRKSLVSAIRPSHLKQTDGVRGGDGLWSSAVGSTALSGVPMRKSGVTQFGAGAVPLALAFAALWAAPADMRAEKPAVPAAPGEKCPFPDGWKPPVDVVIPPGIVGAPFVPFDTFAWDTFVALNWPAKKGQQGVPDETACIGDPADSVVWETFGTSVALFKDNPPPPWNPAGAGALAKVATFRDSELKTTKLLKRFGKVGPAGVARIQAAPDDFDFNQAFSSPLIDQNGNYAVYEVRFDKTAYNFVYNGKFYLKANMPLPPAGFTNASTVVKAGWRPRTTWPESRSGITTRKPWSTTRI